MSRADERIPIANGNKTRHQRTDLADVCVVQGGINLIQDKEGGGFVARKGRNWVFRITRREDERSVKKPVWNYL